MIESRIYVGDLCYLSFILSIFVWYDRILYLLVPGELPPNEPYTPTQKNREGFRRPVRPFETYLGL